MIFKHDPGEKGNKQDEPSGCTSLRTRSSFWAVVQEEEFKQALVILLNGGYRN